uniref:Uncharacterized protein n=1 Tax=Bos mutus grunniens TaxID=30521 RepID=A0A8B9WVX4_BOSMU
MDPCRLQTESSKQTQVFVCNPYKTKLPSVPRVIICIFFTFFQKMLKERFHLYIGNISLSSQNGIHHNMTAALTTSPPQKKKRSSDFFSNPVSSDS